MMLAVPDASVHRTKRTDWLELKAIASPDGRVGFGTLTSATALAEDEQETNIGDENAAEEGLHRSGNLEPKIHPTGLVGHDLRTPTSLVERGWRERTNRVGAER